MNSEVESTNRLEEAALERLRGSVYEHALRSPAEIERRLDELAEERDVERTFEMMAAVLGMTGLFLGIFGRRRYLILPALLLPFLYRSSRRDDAPPLRALRRMGLRTRDEIVREYYALKALRGDFEVDGQVDPASRARLALRAVEAD